MIEKSPEVLATADLTPVSPAPLHLSSPIVVPSLQDQADTLYAMSLSNDGQASTASAAAMERVGAPAQNNMSTTAYSQDGAHSADGPVMHQANLGDNSNDAHSAGGQDGGAAAALLGDERGAQHLSQQDGAAEAPQDVSNSIESTVSSDTSNSLTNHSEVDAPSYDISFTDHAQSMHQPVPSLSPSGAAQDLSEPTKISRSQEEPQDPAVVSSSTDNADLPQPPTKAPAEESDRPSTANDEIDIQSLVDKIIGNASASSANQPSASQNPADVPAPSQAVSLPPRPPMPQLSAQTYVRPEDALNYQPGLSYPNSSTVPSNLPPPPGTYSAGAPGTAPEPRNSTLPPPPTSSLSSLPAHSLPVAQFDPAYAAATGTPPQVVDQQQRWETFLQEERRYVSEAKWDRFPEGSRLFIGNLSSDRVSKKEVFDLFCKYGRLAQISLKQAYGFVQYHTLAEGQAAMDHLQGTEVRGRKIHLEFSRTQKKDTDGEKRGSKNKRDSDRHEGGRGRRDDYRPGRQQSPRRGSHRQQVSYDGNRSYYDDHNSRARSRSPGYGGRDSSHYRRRSPSLYRRHTAEVELDIPRRYGGDIPDVQFLLLQEVERDFVGWVEHAFLNQGLKVQVMFLNPQFPREAVIQRQVMEGVHAVVELDYRAQQTGKISLQVFNRSGGRDNIRYDQYQDLDPNIAAQLVGRAKSQVQLQNPYGGQYPPPQYPQAPQTQYHPPSYPSQPYPGAAAPLGNPGSSLDNATLQKILGSLHNQQGVPHGAHPGQPAGGAPVDVNSVLASLGVSNAAGAIGSNQQHGVGYPPGPANAAPGAPGGDSSQHVQNIMAQLARYRQ